jgi:hypothetical protein
MRSGLHETCLLFVCGWDVSDGAEQAAAVTLGATMRREGVTG